MGERVLMRFETILWAALVLLLPITSLPLVSRLSGGTMVAPAATIPLFGLIVINLGPYLLKQGRLPRLTIPLLGFLFVALLSSALAFFVEFPLFREINRLRNTLVALLTLLIGVSFFLAAISWVNSTEKLRLIYRWVNISGTVLILWSLLQSFFWALDQGYPDWMWQVQRMISTAGNLYDRRTTGLAFEPSWLGHQLVLVFLPYWLAATILKRSAFSKKLWKISVENVLLLGGISVLWLSLARSALVSFLLAFSLVFFRITTSLISSISRKLETKSKSPQKSTFFLWVFVLTIYLGILMAGLYVFTQFDPRMTDLFKVIGQQGSLIEITERMVFGERVALWLAGINIFGKYPILGVGLNNSGYLILENLPVVGWSLVESHKLYYTTALPNTLSLWIRLLAETGVVGFSLFICWIFLLWKTSRYILRAPDPWIRTAAVAGQFTLAALLMEGMSVDTFAFPYFWLPLGWMAAAYRIHNQSNPTTRSV